MSEPVVPQPRYSIEEIRRRAQSAKDLFVLGATFQAEGHLVLALVEAVEAALAVREESWHSDVRYAQVNMERWHDLVDALKPFRATGKSAPEATTNANTSGSAATEKFVHTVADQIVAEHGDTLRKLADD